MDGDEDSKRRVERSKIFLFACLKNDEENANQLLEKGIEVNYRNLHNETALYFLSRTNSRLAHEVLDKGANPAIRTQSNQTVLHQLAISGDTTILSHIREKPENKKFLAGDHRSWDGLSPVHLAAKHGHQQIVRDFYSLGMNISQKSWAGSTPLHFAIAYSRFDVALFLLSNGCSVNARTYSFGLLLKKPHTALHILLHWPDVNDKDENYLKVLTEMILKKARIRGCPSCKGKEPCNIFSRDRLPQYHELKARLKPPPKKGSSLLKKMSRPKIKSKEKKMRAGGLISDSGSIQDSSLSEMDSDSAFGDLEDTEDEEDDDLKDFDEKQAREAASRESSTQRD